MDTAKTRFVVELTDAEQFVLENVRKTLGARSKGDVIRHWIKLATPKGPK